MSLFALLASTSACTLIAGAGALGALALLVVSFARIFLHPLSRYPGPTLAKLTDWYMAYYAWRGDRHLELYRLHQRYGPVVRITPTTLSFNSATALKAIYGHSANVRKADFYTAFPASKAATNVHSSIDRAEHARKRRVLSQAFSDNAIRNVERFIIDNVETGCDVLAQSANPAHISPDGWGAAVNAAEWCNHLTFDIMGDLAFGKSFHMLTSPTNRFAADLVTMAAHRHLICGTSLTLHTAHLDKLLFPSIAAGRQRYLAYSLKQLTERQQLGAETDRKDFFYYILNARDPETGQGFRQNELWGESNVLIIAGSDTTSTALSATFHYLLTNPHALALATAEIRSTFNHQSEIVTGKQLSSCLYSRACIDEAMRLAPPVPGYLPRRVRAGGLTVDGRTLPEGVDVGVPHYVLHHNPDYFPRPYEFIPERWLPGRSWPLSQQYTDESEKMTISSEQTVAAAHSAFCAFSIGPRGCIGKGLAYIELMMSLARVLYLYDIRPVPADEPVPNVDFDKANSDHSTKTQTQTKPSKCPFATAKADKAAGLICPYGMVPLSKGEYPLMDTFTSRKDGPMMQIRNRQSSELHA